MTNLLLAVIYLSFISLGLPDSLLGSAWPVMYGELGVPVSFAGIISMIISICTVISGLMSDRLTRKFGTGTVTAFSAVMTAAAMLGFSVSHSFPLLCALAIPYGLGAGGVDASINNYVALHYKSRHMSWLHCMWGVGAALGPYIMGYALSGGRGWNMGYRYIFLMQTALSAILILSLPLWKKTPRSAESDAGKALSLPEILRLRGVKEIMAAFFFYSAVEQTAMLWSGSYLALSKGVNPESAAAFSSLFFIGITAGRAISGFLTIRLRDTQMIRLGQIVIFIGVLTLILPFGEGTAFLGLVLIGLGCAPIYPCVIHSTPEHFGADKSQAVIGVQMAASYIGTCFMPPLFGIIANHISASLLPFFLLAALIFMTLAHEALIKKAGETNSAFLDTKK